MSRDNKVYYQFFAKQEAYIWVKYLIQFTLYNFSTSEKFTSTMVRFKNRYILAQLIDQEFNQRSLLKYVRDVAEQMMGSLFIAKIAFSLQIKYCSFGYTLIRVPRQHCQSLGACLFASKKLKVIKKSGTIKKVQQTLIKRFRRDFGRQINEAEVNSINKIDYS